MQNLHYRIGLNIGIASIGFAVLRTDSCGLPYRIELMDSVLFPKGENPKNGASLAADRRTYRSGRRLNRRRKFRKYRVRRLFINKGMLSKHDSIMAFHRKPMPSVYRLRAEGLDYRLSIQDLLVVLYHLAGHRGFKSNRKYALNSKDAGPILKAITASRNRVQRSNYRTAGEMLYHSPQFRSQKRNHDYDDGYRWMPSRAMINSEARKILRAQISFGVITKAFADRYMSILDSQRNYDEGPNEPSPYAGDQIDKMIGLDTLDHRYQRGAKGTYTFEMFNTLSRINMLGYQIGLNGKMHPLSKDQRRKAVDFATGHRTMNCYQVRRVLRLPRSTRFNLVPYRAYKISKKAEQKTYVSDFSAVTDIRKQLSGKETSNGKLIDAVGEILSKYSSDDTRRKYFHAYLGKLSDATVDKLLGLNFSKFSKLSLHTMRKLIPYLKQGYLYSDAATKAGYRFTRNRISADYIRSNVTNPVVMRAFTYTRKVVRTIIRRYGEPDGINIELARDLRKPFQERMDIQKNAKQHEKDNDRISARLRKHGIPVNGQNIIIDSLYHEQKGIDPYTGESIPYMKAFNGDGNYYNIDHIIPYSWTFDDSYTNKVLTSTKANADKGNRLPMQYLAHDKERQDGLVRFAKDTIKNYRKRSHLLKKSVSKDQMRGWKQRNLNDTRYLNKLIANYLKQNVQFRSSNELGKQRVVSLNGSMTAKMRARWGIHKYYRDGKHRHFGSLSHAVDAVVIGSITPAFVDEVNIYSKYIEASHNPQSYDKQSPTYRKLAKKATSGLFKKFVNGFPLPWRDFHDEIYGRTSRCPAKTMAGRPWEHYTSEDIRLLKPIKTVRVASHHVDVKVNKDTRYGAEYLDKGLILRHVHVDQLKLDKHGQIRKGRWRYFNQPDGGDAFIKDQLVKQMKMHDGSGKKAFPHGYMRFRDVHGHPFIVRRVKMIAKNHAHGVISRDGRSMLYSGGIVRLDVFYDGDKYKFVTVYPDDAVKSYLPTRIQRTSNKPKYLSRTDEFQFSLYQDTPVKIVFKRPENAKDTVTGEWHQIDHFCGYYTTKGSNASIDLLSFNGEYKLGNIGISSCKKIDKLTIDYLGNVHRVRHEPRLMPGA